MRSWVVLLGLLVTAGGAGGCESHWQPEDIIIGTITSLTGDLETLGPGWRNAVALAVLEANSAGGVLSGNTLVLDAEDDRSGSGGGDAAQALVDAGAVGIIGAPASGSSLAAVEITGPERIPQISGASTSAMLNADDGEGGDAHPYFFRTVPDDGLQGFVLAQLANGAYNAGSLDVSCMRLAIINVDNAYGSPFAAELARHYRDLGGNIAIERAYADDLPSDRYGEIVSDMLAATPDCVALLGYPGQAADIVLAWYAQGGSDVTWLGTDGTKDAELQGNIAAHTSGFIGTAPASDPSRIQYRDFVRAYSNVYGEEPVVLSETIYDAAALLILAIARSDSTEGDNIAAALVDVSSWQEGDQSFGPGQLVRALDAIHSGHDVNYDGGGGNVDFQPRGNVVADYEVWRWDGTAFQTAATVRADDILAGLQ